MNNMINLIKLHYSSIVALKKTALVVFVLAVIAVLSKADGSMLPFGAGLIIMILNYNTLVYEDNSKSSFLIYSLPVKPKEYILSKYLFGIMNLIITLIFANLTYIVLNMMNVITSTDIPMGVLNVSIIIIGIVVVDILMPIALIVGFNKARIILLLLAIGPVCLSNALASLISNIGFPKIHISLGMIELSAAIFGIIISVVSYLITAKLYEQKDIN